MGESGSNKTGWEKILEEPGERKYAPPSERNQGPILEVLKEYLPVREGGSAPLRLLEIASGTGQHAAFMANELHVTWIPSDVDPVCLSSVKEYTAGMTFVCEPLTIDASSDFEKWNVEAGSIDAILNCNMIHISPYCVMEGFIAGSGCACKSGGKLFIYGPFKVDGKCTPESNENFDAMLRRRNPSFGIRDQEDVVEKAAAAGFHFLEKKLLPANNCILVFQKL